jgi:LuxR family maltose regulon positive regulatory protein
VQYACLVSSVGQTFDVAPTLLRPKFLPPLTRESYVRRDRLHDRMSRASATRTTLVSAPAGCGKTALLASWLTELPPGRWSWLTLDSRDNDPVRFWAYVIEALRALADGVGERALSELIRSGGRGPADRWMESLINDSAAVDRPTSYLILDDLHLITDPEIRAGLALFAANMPPWLRLVIATRADPALPLPRMRADGQLTEIRQSDLRFEPTEADRLLRAEGVDHLDDEQLDWLVTRTEGWAAGLQLAAIVLGADPAPRRLLHLAGSDRPFADYIASEVLDVETDDMRTFLFTTSVLERVNPSLAHAVSGLADAGQLLRQAQQRGLFLVALDEHDEWFRYHTLFAEAIQSEARARAPEVVRLAHEQAARWFEQRDDLTTAIEHWSSAGRADEALRIGLVAGYRLVDSGQVNGVERIADLIPASIVGNDPVRQLDYAMLHFPHDADAFASWVDEARATIAELADVDDVDDDLMRHYQTVRAICDLVFGEWDDAATHASASIGPLGLGEGQTAMMQRAGLQLMRAKAWLEEPAEVERIFTAIVRRPRASPIVRDFIAPCTWALASAIGGRIRESTIWCTRATKTADAGPVPQAPYQELLLARALIARELGDNAAARDHLDELRAVYTVTYHSLRTIADVESALAFISDDLLADAARALENIESTQPRRPLGPRVHDAVDGALDGAPPARGRPGRRPSVRGTHAARVLARCCPCQGAVGRRLAGTGR